MANCVHWYGHVLIMEYGDILRMTLEFKVEGRKMGG